MRKKRGTQKAPGRLRGFEPLEAKRLLSGNGLIPEANVDDLPTRDGTNPAASQPTGETTEAYLAADIDGDGQVGFSDFLLLTKNFGATDASFAMGDLDGDSQVGFADFLLITKNFGMRRPDEVPRADPSDTPRNDRPEEVAPEPHENGVGADDVRRGPPSGKAPRGPSTSTVFVETRADFTARIQKKQHPATLPFAATPPDARVVYRPVLQAGIESGTPVDSPSLRIDPNTPAGSPFAGVGSLEIIHPSLGTFICSGSVISDRHALTAAHCFDLESPVDGVPDLGLTATFNLNDGGSPSSTHTVSTITIHPDFTGFSSDVNDDLAVIEFATPVPTSTPKYAVDAVGMTSGERLQLVGYGESGFGDKGFSVLPNFVDKRSGENMADLLLEDDEGSDIVELFLYDFDEPTGTDPGRLGGITLGNHLETSVGGGDSGGPALVSVDGDLVIAGVNTFELDLGAITPPSGHFGSLAGGVVVAASADWIASTMAAAGVNQPPSFIKGPDQFILEDAGAQSVDEWATEISAGTAEEASQTVAFNVTGNTNPGLFAVAPMIDAVGTLIYTPAADANGSADITIELVDDGGTSSGGDDTSRPQTFTINVEAVNDEPSFVIAGNQVVGINEGEQVVADFATGFDPGGGVDEENQRIDDFIVANDNNDLFSIQPDIDNGGQLRFAAASDAFGVATVSVQVRDDGGSANGGDDTSEILTFVISVLSESRQIRLLEQRVQHLVDVGDLNQGLGKSLSAKLVGTWASLEDGQTKPAKNKINAFIKEVNGLISNGKLAAAEGERLINAAEAIRVGIL